MILAPKTAMVHLQDKHVHTLLQPGIIYLGSGGWGLVEGWLFRHSLELWPEKDLYFFSCLMESSQHGPSDSHISG